ncbi:hypothetical protein [Spongiactinospora sp. TRM90649]|uniref:hypothetical protein n=1 Tax=Spongiactinospora sp. TRM90649 TaxID=3031114 RepID=UPI0023FA2000|nr:hypothetical protein [Spongiactinospora sp. TRM90649]MDF5755751.1 hypothetical protein [Spongiactinospora sp. TRM90649]
MDLNDAVTYYTDLLHSSAPFGETLAWTVVRPVQGPPPSVEDVASRLTGGGSPVLVESDEEFTEEAVFMDGPPVYLGATGAVIMLTEPSGFSYAARQQVMAWLSQDAQVWHLSWNVAGTPGLEYAAHGRYLARIPSLEPESLYGVDPGALEEEAAALQAVAGAPWPAQKATAMAVIEARTGARLPGDWYEHPRTVATIDPLLGEECPPIGPAAPRAGSGRQTPPGGSGAPPYDPAAPDRRPDRAVRPRLGRRHPSQASGARPPADRRRSAGGRDGRVGDPR